jgi:phytoene synthase
MDRNAIAGSSFATAARLLPPRSRQAVLDLYAACRALDDVADGQGGQLAQSRLSRVAQDLSGHPATAISPEAQVFRDLARRHGFDLAPARRLVETLAGDLRPARLETEAELLEYAHGAAGTVGEMMCELLCTRGASADIRVRAADLGIAMQLTNIARDVAEDARMGRRYLPSDWCALPPDRLAAPDPADRDVASKAVLRTLTLAERRYARAREGYGALPPRARLAVALAAERYREIGRRIMARPGIVWERRARPAAAGHVRCAALGLSRAIPQPARHRDRAGPRHA